MLLQKTVQRLERDFFSIQDHRYAHARRDLFDQVTADFSFLPATQSWLYLLERALHDRFQK